MKHPLFYLKLAAASFLALLSSYMMTTGLSYRGLLGGITGFTVIFLLRSASVSSRKTGRTGSMKLALINAYVLTELILLLGAFTLPVVPKYLASITLATVAFVEILKLESLNRFKTNLTLDAGREGRLAVLGISLGAYQLNTYFLFYGLILLSLLSVYDSLRIIHQLREEL